MAEDDSRPSRGGGVLTAAAMTVIAVSMAKVAAEPEGEGESTESHAHRSPAPPSTTKSGWMGKLDLYQQARKPLAFIVGVVKKFGDDRAGRLAALVAYYGFFSIFPAMLALVTVLGFALDGNDELRKDIANSALAQFPVIGDDISRQVGEPLSGNAFAFIIGIGGALWAGMGAMQAAQDAMNEVWDVPRTNHPSFLKKRLRSILMLLLIVVGLGVSSTISQLAVNVVEGVVATIVLFIATAACNVIMYLVAFRVLTVARLSWRAVFPGAVVAGVAYSVLQVVGALYITRTLKGAEDTYGTFAVVIGLLSWIFLIAQLTMMSAEVNVVAYRHEWPRSLFSEAATPSDERSMAAKAEENKIASGETVDVSFDGEPAPAHADARSG